MQLALQSDGLLMGRLVRTRDHQWHATWDLQLGNQHLQWQTTESDINLLIQNTYRNLTDSLAEQFAILASNEKNNQVMITIDDVNNANEYAHIIHYLKNITFSFSSQCSQCIHESVNASN